MMPPRFRIPLGGLVPAVTLLLAITSCDGSSSAASTARETSAFAGSDVVTERYGTRTTRDLERDVDDATRSAVVRAINDFSFDLHRAIAAAAPDAGSVQSGYSAAVALSLAGAATGGDTRADLATLLGLDALVEDDIHAALNELALALESRTNDDLVLRTANRVFVRPGLELQSGFLDTATADYGAPVIEADFVGAPEEVAAEINRWVSEQTDGFIPTLVERIDPRTVFALLNAIFLDATWQDAYEGLGERPFATPDGTIREVPSFGGRSNLPRLVREDLTAIEIPYGGGELAMLIMAPDALEAFEASLDTSSLDAVIGAMETADVELSVPNWEESATLDLVELLSPLGLPANPWDFGRLVEGGTTLEVLARQRARIEVDENGTRAAAATVVAGIESVPEPLVIDRPFVYALRDRTSGAVLFTGRVLAP